MNKFIYLVVNCLDIKEPFIINICTTLAKAFELKDNYIKNSEYSDEEDPENIFKIIVLDLEDESNLLWDYEYKNYL